MEKRLHDTVLQLEDERRNVEQQKEIVRNCVFHGGMSSASDGALKRPRPRGRAGNDDYNDADQNC